MLNSQSNHLFAFEWMCTYVLTLKMYKAKFGM